MNTDVTFGEIVRERRSELGLTQSELARRVGCAVVTLRKIEADSLRPSVQMAERLALALKIPEGEQIAFVRLARAQKPPSPLPTPSPSRAEIGQEDLSGRAVKGFQLGQRIGSGGFGVVYQAQQVSVERSVAVKIILPKFADQPEFIRRFEAEAQIVARLEHPHIVPLYDYWREPAAAYLIMRLLLGGSLEDLLRSGPLPIEDFRLFIQQVGLALAAAHRGGVVHRDIKPANILLDQDRNAYLADFGIAKQLNGELADDLDGTLIGSPAYLSPEQIRSDPIKPQTDIYSLGLLIYEMLSGVKPFQGPTPVAYLQQHLTEMPSSILDHNPELPPEIDIFLSRAMAKDPSLRFDSVLEMLAEMDRILLPLAAAGFQVELPQTLQEMATQIIEEAENPYKGLRAFTEADSDEFFGRDTLVQEMLARLSEESDLARFLAVVGPSGSGKSSAVLAGLVPTLRSGALPGSDRWFITDFIPGPQPWQELEEALLRVAVNPPADLRKILQYGDGGLVQAVKSILPNDGETELLLVVDQFEELFTQVVEEKTRADFLASLVEAVLDPESRLRLVTTLRADFTDRPLSYVDLGEIMRQRTVFTLPMTPEECEEAIVRPAEGVGVSLEPGLVATIVQDVGDQPGTLPLLQYALTELFEQREGRVMTLSVYQHSGGVRGALGRRAEEIYKGLDSIAQALTRQVFLRLVTLGEGIEDTRRRVLISELEAIQTSQVSKAIPGPTSEVSEVLDSFGRARLLTFDRDPATREPTVEVAHEALLREWERLRVWLDESRADVRLQRLLGASAAEWLAASKDPGFLLRGSRLTQFEDWAQVTDLALTGAEQTYLEASLAERRKREAAEAERAAHEAELERRSRNRLRAMVGIFAVAAFIAIALSIFAFDRQAAAEENEALAIEGRATATVAQGAAVFQAATAEAERVRAESEAQARATQQALAEAEASARATAQADAEEQKGAAEEQRAIAVDQKAVAEDEARAALEAYSLTLATHAEKALDELDSATALALALAASNIEDPPKEVVQTLKRAAYAPGARQQYTVTTEQGEVKDLWSLAISPDGSTIVAGLAGGTIVVLDIESGQTSYPFAGHSLLATSLAFSPDGSLLLSGGFFGDVILWDVATGEEIQRFSGPTGAVYTVDFSPDGKTAVSGSFAMNDLLLPGELFLWNLESGEEIRRFEGGHNYGLRSVAISPDGQTLLSGDYNFSNWGGEPGSPLILWDLESGEIIHRFPAPLAYAQSVVFHPDGRTAFAVALNKIYEWDLETGEQIRDFEGHNNDVRMIDISHDGRRMISSDLGGGVILWDLVFGEPVTRFSHGAANIYVAFHPDGRTALSASRNGTVVLWDLYNANEIRRFEGHEGGVNEVAFTPDGRTILSAGGSIQDRDVPGVDNSVRVWDMQTGEQVQILEGHESVVLRVKVSPDGNRALTLSEDDTVIYWDLESGAELQRFNHPGTPFSIAFHPDGKRALIGTGEPSLLVWDLDSGEVIDTLFGHEDWVTGLDVSPDGKTMLSGDSQGSLILWDFESGQQLSRLYYDNRIHGQLWNVIFSPDGRQVFTQSNDSSVVVWDTGTWEILKSFNQIEGQSWIGMLALGSNGKIVASADKDGNVLVRDIERDEILHSISTSRRLPVQPAISPDGRYLLLGSQDHTVTLWDLKVPTLEELQSWIKENRQVREFSCQERVQYQIEPLCEEAAVPELVLMPPAPKEAGYVQPVHTAQIGENRGEIALGEWDIWLYEGRAGEAITITMIADNPYTPGSSLEEQIELGQLDTFLFVISPDATLLVKNDDDESGETANSIAEGLVLPADGTYEIHARSWEDSTAGAYTLIIEVAEEEE